MLHHESATMEEELSPSVAETSPEVLVLTETKLTERTQHKCWLCHLLRDYWICCNEIPTGFQWWILLSRPLHTVADAKESPLVSCMC